MSDYKIGEIVALTAGSMRMAVESVDGDTVSTVWCHEGQIGRDTEEPGPGLPGLVLERTNEGLLGQIPGPVRVPHLSVEEADQVRERGSIQLIPVDAHRVSAVSLKRDTNSRSR